MIPKLRVACYAVRSLVSLLVTVTLANQFIMHTFILLQNME
jgi:hypothetical protein